MEVEVEAEVEVLDEIGESLLHQEHLLPSRSSPEQQKKAQMLQSQWYLICPRLLEVSESRHRKSSSPQEQ